MIVVVSLNMNAPTRAYRDKLRTYFDQYTEDTINAMKVIFTQNFEDDVRYIDFVMFAYDRFSDTMPIHTWPTNQSNEVSDLVCPISSIPIEDFEYYDWDLEDDVEMTDELKDIAAIWLSDVWRSAGGENFSLPCFFTDHDDLTSRRLDNLKTVANDPRHKST